MVQVSAAALHQNGSATVYTQTNAFPVAPTANNSAVLIMSCHDNGVGARPSSVTIGGVAAVHALAAEHDTTSTRESCWYVQDLGAAPNRNVVITYATATDRYQTFGVIECTPLAASPVDQARGVYWYDGGGWPQVISLPGATTQASELLLVMTICGSGQANINITSPAATGYTNLFNEIDSNTYQGGQASYKLLTATETSTASWTNTGATSDHWSTVMCSFKFP